MRCNQWRIEREKQRPCEIAVLESQECRSSTSIAILPFWDHLTMGRSAFELRWALDSCSNTDESICNIWSAQTLFRPLDTGEKLVILTIFLKVFTMNFIVNFIECKDWKVGKMAAACVKVGQEGRQNGRCLSKVPFSSSTSHCKNGFWIMLDRRKWACKTTGTTLSVDLWVPPRGCCAVCYSPGIPTWRKRGSWHWLHHSQ